MRVFTTCTLVVFYALCAHAQKEDYTWIMGMGNPFPDSTAKLNYIDFKDDTFAVQLLIKDNPMFGANSVVSDSMGNLLAYTNDINIYNRYHNPILNGTGFQSMTQYPSGFPLDQSVLILPLPDTTLYVMIDATYEDIVIDVIVKKLRYSILDLSFNNFQGKVLQKNMTIPNSQDTLNIGFINAVRHANGDDWWVMVTKFGTNIHRKYLVTKEGVQFDHDQPIGDLVENGVGFGAFSPDGRWYARYMAYGNTSDPKSKMYLYAFDRCTGQLSTPISRDYPSSSGVYGGCVYAPNSQFSYVSKGTYIYQYNLNAPDILGSELVVATYDGFTDANGLPTYFYAFQLAPDGKLYGIINGFNSHYLHVINQPNLSGDSCQVLQHAIYLPAYNFGTIPNLPNYRLGAYDGICDSVGSYIPSLTNTSRKLVHVWPNPVVDFLNLSVEASITARVDFRVFDLAGKVALSHKNLSLNPSVHLNISELPQGAYYYIITESGKPIKQGKLIKMR